MDRKDVLTATVDQLQAEIDRLAREIFFLWMSILALVIMFFTSRKVK